MSDVSNTVETLTDAALIEYRLSYGAAANALDHAIQCGVILLEIQQTVPAGKWGKWCETHVSEIGFTTVTKFCRLAQYRDRLTEGGFETIDRAMGHLRALSIPRRPSGPMRQPLRLDVEEAKRLRSQGANYEEIGELCGVSATTVAIHLDPKRRASMQARERDRKRRMVAARAALLVKERDAEVRKRGGSAAEAYALLRRTALVLDRAIIDATDAGERARLTAALGFCHKAEDEIVSAIRIERQAS